MHNHAKIGQKSQILQCMHVIYRWKGFFISFWPQVISVTLSINIYGFLGVNDYAEICLPDSKIFWKLRNSKFFFFGLLINDIKWAIPQTHQYNALKILTSTKINHATLVEHVATNGASFFQGGTAASNLTYMNIFFKCQRWWISFLLHKVAQK